MVEFPQLKRIIEAALLASPQPLSLPQLSTLFTETEQPAHADLARALDDLALDCATRGVELKEVASGFRYQVRQEVHPWVARLWTERQARYSRALLETLSLIAYRQPITRGEIEQIRGVAVSSNIVKTLEEREWVRVVGYRDVPGKPELFGTTRGFLDYFNLKSLDELPPLAEIRDLSDYDPQLGLAPVSIDVESADTTTFDDMTGAAVRNASNEDINVTRAQSGQTESAEISGIEANASGDLAQAHAASGDSIAQALSETDAAPASTEQPA